MTNTVKKVIAGISTIAIIAGAAVGGWAVNGYVIKDNSFSIENPITDDNGGMEIGAGSGSNGIKLMSTNISTADYDEYGISPMAESAQQITATVTPSNAANQLVDWSVAWVNSSSSWASGKTVTDYVTVTPVSDGALTANVECKQAFGEQIKITATSRENDNVSGSCTADYEQKYSGTKTSIYFTSSSDYNQGGIISNVTGETVASVNVPLKAQTGYNTNTAPKQSVRYSAALSETYTIALGGDTSVNFKYYVKLNSSFLTALKGMSNLSSGTFAEDWTLFDETTCNLSQADAAGFASSEEYTVIDYFRILCSSLCSAVAPQVYYINNSTINSFIEAARDYLSSYHFEIKIVATFGGENFETVTPVRFTDSSLAMHITNIALGPSIIF